MPEPSTTSTPRLIYLDNIKVLMIAFVVMMHAAVTYSGMGNWYLTEPSYFGKVSWYTFSSYQAFTSAYFISVLFLISGYFVPHSLERKGTKKFILDRLVRLGIPTLLYMFFINLICEMMSHPNTYSFHEYFHGIITFKFLEWSGPLWFVLALLIFSIVYVIIRKWCDALFNLFDEPSWKNILGLISLITIGAFVLRIFFPRNINYMNMQLSNFSSYIFMFLVGILAYQKNIFEKIAYEAAIKWLYFSLGMNVLGMLFFPHFFYTEGQKTFFIGDSGINWISFLYALWESIISVSMSIALIGIFKKQYNHPYSLQSFLSTNSFGVYVFHAPTLIAITLLMEHFELPALLEWLIVSAMTLIATFIFVSCIRTVPLFRKIFS